MESNEPTTHHAYSFKLRITSPEVRKIADSLKRYVCRVEQSPLHDDDVYVFLFKGYFAKERGEHVYKTLIDAIEALDPRVQEFGAYKWSKLSQGAKVAVLLYHPIFA